MTITKQQFIDWLEAKHACGPALAWAREQASAEAILATERNDWLVWLVERIQGPAWGEYQRIRSQAWGEYQRIQGPAWGEYQRIRSQAARQALTWERVVEAVLP